MSSLILSSVQRSYSCLTDLEQLSSSTIQPPGLQKGCSISFNQKTLMAEIAGLAFSVVALGPYLIKWGYELLVVPLQSLDGAPKIVREIESFGHSLHQGKLKIDIELTAWALSQDDLDQDIKDALGAYLTR